MNTIPEEIIPKRNIAFSIFRLANQKPNSIAIIDRIDNIDREFSYQDLKNRILALTASLIKKGVKKDDTIAIVSQSRIEILEIFFSSMQIGAIPFTVNPKQSILSIKHIFTETNPKCIFFESTCGHSIQEFLTSSKSDHLISIGPFIHNTETYDQNLKTTHTFLKNELCYEAPRAITYTSGSTGTPKGVINTLKPLMNIDVKKRLFRAGIRLYNSIAEERSDVKLIVRPLFHNTVGPLYSMTEESKIILMRDFDQKTLLRYLDKYKSIHTILLPYMLAKCLREKQLIKLLDFSHLKLISLIGAPCSRQLMEEAQAALNCRVITFYGTIEAIPELTFEGLNLDEIPINSVGKASKNSNIKLIDSLGKESNFGEMWFKNPVPFEGYYKQDMLTKSKLNNNWFMTGDIFQREKGGLYFYYGRKDDMFICNGENVYPLEIENVLCSHEDVIEACVVPLNDPDHGQIPTALVTCGSNHNVSSSDLINYCLMHGLTDLYPRYIGIVDSLPIRGPGKIDRNKVGDMVRKSFNEK